MSVLQYSDSTLGYLTLKYCTLLYFAVLVFQSGAKIKTHLFFPYLSLTHVLTIKVLPREREFYFTDKTGQVTGSVTVVTSHSLLVFIPNDVSSIDGSVCDEQGWTQNQSTLPPSPRGQEVDVTGTKTT